MAETGYNWGAWGAVNKAGPAAITNESLAASGGAISSLIVDLDVKAACEVSVKAVFSNHAIAAGTGLQIGVLRDTDGGTNFETLANATAVFLLPGTQAATIYKTFSVDPGQVGSFILSFTNTNTTASNTCVITVQYRTATIPVAS